MKNHFAIKMPIFSNLSWYHAFTFSILWKIWSKNVEMEAYHSVVTVPVFSNMSWIIQGSLPSGAALKLKSRIARVYTGGLRLWLKRTNQQQLRKRGSLIPDLGYDLNKVKNKVNVSEKEMCDPISMIAMVWIKQLTLPNNTYVRVRMDKWTFVKEGEGNENLTWI